MRDLSPSELAQLADYLGRETTAQENTEIEQWLAQSAERSAFVEYLTRPRAESFRASAIEEARVETMLQRMLGTMRQGISYDPQPSTFVTQASSLAEGDESLSRRADRPLPSRRGLTRLMPHRLWYTMAGLGLGCLLLVGSWYLGARSVPTASSARHFSYITAKGERASVVLPDGSVVVLNVASQLQVPVDYDRGNRNLQLNGEAMFSVTPSPAHPLTVQAGASTTRVLGTRFVVRHYDTDTAATITVREGRVSTQSTVLNANQQAVVSHQGLVSVQTPKLSEFTFVIGVLTLDYQSLLHAIPDLNRWYDVDIRIGSPELSGETILGEFAAGSVADLIRIFEMTLDIRVERAGRILTLYKRGS